MTKTSRCAVLGILAALSLGSRVHAAGALDPERTELPPGQNTYAILTNVLAELERPEDPLLEEAFSQAWDLGTNMPAGEARRKLDAWKALLPSPPLDLFTDKPVRYSREKAILWSVGPDGIDDGGDVERDIVVELPRKGE